MTHSRPLRVLHVALNLQAGGLERLIAQFARHSTERIESQVLTLESPGRFGNALADQGVVYVAEKLSRWSMLWPGGLIRTIRRVAPDVVHTHSGVWYKASLAARMAGVSRVIHTDHGRVWPVPLQDRLVDSLAARRTDIVVAVSHELAHRLAASAIVDRSRIRVIVNGVDTDEFRPSPDDGRMRAELGIGPGTPVIGSVGRLAQVKRYDLMIEAFAVLRAGWLDRGGEPPVLVIAGEGPEETCLRELVAALGLASSVRIIGWRDDVSSLHSALALFTLSSSSEGTSVSLLEAMSSGLCPVVSDVGGNAAVLGERLRHRLVPAGNVAALVRAWRSALDDGEARRRDRRVARERVLGSFRLQAMLDGYAALYLDSSPRSPTSELPEVSLGR